MFLRKSASKPRSGTWLRQKAKSKKYKESKNKSIKFKINIKVCLNKRMTGKMIYYKYPFFSWISEG